MTIREKPIAILQRLSESLLQEITDFINFFIHKHQTQIKAMRYNEIVV